VDNTPGDKLGVWRDMRLADALVYTSLFTKMVARKKIQTYSDVNKANSVKAEAKAKARQYKAKAKAKARDLQGQLRPRPHTSKDKIKVVNLQTTA